MGRPLQVEPWQQDDLNLIFELRQDGSRAWRDVLWLVPRGNGKSPITGGVGLYELTSRRDAPDVYCAAGSRDQAAIVHDFARGFASNPPLSRFLTVRAKTIFCAANNGKMQTIAADGDLQHGLSPSAAIMDELHVLTTDKQEESFFAMQSAMQKRGGVMIAPTTVGKTKFSILGERWDAMMKHGDVQILDDGYLVVVRDEAAGMLMIHRGAPEDADVEDPEVWRRANPASWIPDGELARLAKTLPRAVFMRLILNIWVVGDARVFAPDQWDACESGIEIPKGADIWIAVDVGERRDSSAISWAWSHPSGRLITRTKIFEPREDGSSLLPELEAHIRGLCSRYQHLSLGYDPWQFRRSAELLSSEGVTLWRRSRTSEPGFAQNDSLMVPASQGLFDLVNDGVIAHEGGRELRRHMMAVEAKITSRGAWRLVKPTTPTGRRTDTMQRVDGAISLAMVGHMASGEEDSELFADAW